MSVRGIQECGAQEVCRFQVALHFSGAVSMLWHASTIWVAASLGPADISKCSPSSDKVYHGRHKGGSVRKKLLHLQGLRAGHLRKRKAPGALWKAQAAAGQSPEAAQPPPSPVLPPCTVSSRYRSSQYFADTRPADAEQSRTAHLFCCLRRVSWRDAMRCALVACGCASVSQRP